MKTKKTGKKVVTDAQRAEWAQEREGKIEAAKMALVTGVRALKSGAEWAELLKRMAVAGKLSPARLSFQNQILVWVQAPTTRRVATYQAWIKVGRQVRKGEKSITIMAPRPFTKTDKATGDEKRGIFFRALPVFAEEQTDVVDASKLPGEGPMLPRIEDVETFEHTVTDLRTYALTLDDVTAIVIRAREAGDRPGAEGWCNTKTGEIVVIETDRTRTEQFSCLVHEIGHATMHKWGEHHARDVAEVEAESVAFVVCHALGLDTGKASFPYVATWAGKGEDPVKAVLASGKRISDAAQKILACIADACEASADASADEGGETMDPKPGAVVWLIVHEVEGLKYGGDRAAE